MSGRREELMQPPSLLLAFSLPLHWVMLQKARKEGLGGDIQNKAGCERGGSQEVNQIISLFLSPHKTERPCSDSRQKTSSLLICDPLIHTPFRISVHDLHVRPEARKYPLNTGSVSPLTSNPQSTQEASCPVLSGGVAAYCLAI